MALRLPVVLGLVSLASLLSGCSQEREDPMRRFQVMGADLRHGQRLMAQYQCGSCHAVPEVFAAGGRSAPSLADYGRRSYIAGHLPNTPEALQRFLLDPPAELPGARMPKLGLSEDDARDIAGYLMSLR